MSIFNYHRRNHFLGMIFFLLFSFLYGRIAAVNPNARLFAGPPPPVQDAHSKAPLQIHLSKACEVCFEVLKKYAKCPAPLLVFKRPPIFVLLVPPPYRPPAPMDRDLPILRI